MVLDGFQVWFRIFDAFQLGSREHIARYLTYLLHFHAKM